MKEYILLTDSDIDRIREGCELKHEMNNGAIVYLMSKKHFDAESITNEQWKEAIEYLNMLIVEYASLGWPGGFGLNGVLVPLKKRYVSGERTRELYDEIMKCE